jgi:hypothetical protein
MEIRLKGTAIACVAMQDIKAGLAVKLVASGNTFPSIEYLGVDVMRGAQLPTADEDANAKYVAGFRVYNEKPPLYESLPTRNQSGNTTTQAYTLRQVDSSDNLPASVTLRMTSPRLQDEQTIASGALMLAYDNGIYTVTSGCFISAGLAVGSDVSVNGTGANAGKWQLKSSTGKVGKVFEYDSTNGKLTIKTGADA